MLFIDFQYETNRKQSFFQFAHKITKYILNFHAFDVLITEIFL